MNIGYSDLTGAAAAGTVSPTITVQSVHPKEIDMIATAHLVGAADGRQVRFQGFGTRYVVSAEQTGGAFAVVEHDLALRSLGAPMHTHEREDEITHATAGRPR